jgi:hypothetical protein
VSELARRLGQLEVELADAIETDNERAMIRVYYARAAAWHAFAAIQRGAGRDYVPALVAARRDEVTAVRLGTPFVYRRAHDPLSYGAAGAALVGLLVFPILFGPLAVVLGLASPRNDFRSWSAVIVGAIETGCSLLVAGVFSW